MVSFRSPRKISSYLVRAKLYPLDRAVGSTKCGKKSCENFMNVSKTNTFTSNITSETYEIYHKLTCDDNCLIYLFPRKYFGKQFVGKLGTGIDGITIRIMIESTLVRRAVCKNICLNILIAWGTMVSLTMLQ